MMINIIILDNLRYRRATWPSQLTSLPLTAYHMRELFYCRGKLPECSIGPIKIGNVQVKLLSRDEARTARQKHRIIATCPVCETGVPFGRLQQHLGSKRCEKLNRR